MFGKYAANLYVAKHPYQSVVSIELLCNFIEIALWQGCSPVNLLHIFRTPFPLNTSGGLQSNTLRLNFCYLKLTHFVHPRYQKIIGDILKTAQN